MSLTVVSGALIRNNRILLTQRRANVDFPNTHECPGGKVQGRETCYEALVRELDEEVGVQVVSASFIFKKMFEGMQQGSERKDVSFWMYWVLCDGDPVAREGQGMDWFSVDELQKLTLAPGNQAALETLVKLMKKIKGP